MVAMSLMNDALRKKNRETAGIPASMTVADKPRKPPANWRLMAVLVVVGVITASALAGVCLVQSNAESPLGTRVLPSKPIPASMHPGRLSPAAVQTTEDTASTKALPETGQEEPTGMAAGHLSASASAGERPAPDGSKLTTSSVRKSNASTASQIPEGDRSSSSQGPHKPEETLPNNGPRREATSADVQPFYGKAIAYHRSNRLIAAVPLYQKVLRAQPEHTGARLNLAAVFMKQGNYHDARKLLQRLEPVPDRPPGVLLNLAIASIGMGEPETALNYLDRAQTEEDAQPDEIRFHRALVYTKLDRLPEALQLYEQALMEQPEDPLIRFNMALTCDAMGHYAVALAHYEAVVKKDLDGSGIDRETVTQRIRTIRRYLNAIRKPVKRQ